MGGVNVQWRSLYKVREGSVSSLAREVSEYLKKIILALFIAISLLVIGLFAYVKQNPPLVTGTIGGTMNQHGVLVGIGNGGLMSLEIDEVLINQHIQPSDEKIQVSNPIKGLLITSQFDDEAQAYHLRGIDELSIDPGTSPRATLEKMKNGTATEEDVSYGLSVIHDEAIKKVIIQYSYMGLSFEKEIEIEF